MGIDAGPKRPAEENLGPNPKKPPTPVFKRPMPDYKKLFADKISITDKDTQDVVEFTLSVEVYSPLTRPDPFFFQDGFTYDAEREGLLDARITLFRVGKFECLDKANNFVLEFFGSGKWSYLAKLFPENCFYHCASGPVLMELVDIINRRVGVSYCRLIDVSEISVRCGAKVPVRCPKFQTIPLAMLSLLTTGYRWYAKFGFVSENQIVKDEAEREFYANDMGMLHFLQTTKTSRIFSESSTVGKMIDPSGMLTLQAALIKLKENWKHIEMTPSCQEVRALSDFLTRVDEKMSLESTSMRKTYKGASEAPRSVNSYAFVQLSPELAFSLLSI
jgi:hypothetical protein